MSTNAPYPTGYGSSPWSGQPPDPRAFPPYQPSPGSYPAPGATSAPGAYPPGPMPSVARKRNWPLLVASVMMLILGAYDILNMAYWYHVNDVDVLASISDSGFLLSLVLTIFDFILMCGLGILGIVFNAKRARRVLLLVLGIIAVVVEAGFAVWDLSDLSLSEDAPYLLLDATYLLAAILYVIGAHQLRKQPA